jgi:N utilization substance protein B
MKAQNDPRHQARIIALQTLFEWSFNSTDIEDLVERDLNTYSEMALPAESRLDVDRDLAIFLTKGVTENLDAIDKIVASSAPEWPISQIAKVDLEILRIAIFELYIAKSVPPKVAIDEAVELAKEFGGENSSKFVNGVLGTVIKQLLPQAQKERAEKHE